MDDNVMQVLQLLQDGKISAQEAEMLITALRGEGSVPKTAAPPPPEEKKKENPFTRDTNGNAPKFDLDNLGERISKAVAKVQPEKIVRTIQTQLRSASKAGANWGASMSAKIRTWSDGSDTRPKNPGAFAEHADTHEQEFHLEHGASVMIENPLGNVVITGQSEGPASVTVRKLIWSEKMEDIQSVLHKITVDLQGTDTRLDVRVSAPDSFSEGTVDLEIKLPKSVDLVHVSTHFGDVDLGGINGRAEAGVTSGALKLHDIGGDVRGETVSGELHIARIGGAATVATQSGSISAEDIRKGLTASSASGEVRAARVEGGKIECKSVSGDVNVEEVGMDTPLDISVESVSGDAKLKNASGNIVLKAISGDVYAEHLTAAKLQVQTMSGDVGLRLQDVFSGTMQVSTVSGDVLIAIPEGSNARVVMSTTSGSLRCEHDAHDVIASGTVWSGQFGNGAGTLNVQTISGDAHLQRA